MSAVCLAHLAMIKRSTSDAALSSLITPILVQTTPGLVPATGDLLRVSGDNRPVLVQSSGLTAVRLAPTMVSLPMTYNLVHGHPSLELMILQRQAGHDW